MRFIRQLTALLILGLFLLPIFASASWDFSQKNFLQALEEIARRGKFHIFADVPSCHIASFTCPESTSAEEVLARLCKEAGYHAWEIGNSFLVITREQYLKREGRPLRFFHPEERPAESFVSNLPPEFPKDLVPFVIREANLLVFSSFPEELNTGEEAVQKWDVPAKNLHVSMNIIPSSHPPVTVISSFSFLVMEGVSVTANIPFSTPEKTVSATFSFQLQDSENLKMQAVFSALRNPGMSPLSVLSSSSLSKHSWQAFQSSSPDLEISGKWNSFTLPKTSLAVASIARAPRWAPTPSADSPASPGQLMNLCWPDKLFVDALQSVVASASVNLVCSSFCSGTISIFCFGEDLYHEEFINLITKTKDLVVRKIGNSWIVAEQGLIQDTFDRGFFLTKRLQIAHAKQSCQLLKNLFSHFGMLPSIQLSFDTLINAVLVGGKSRLIDDTKYLLEIIDQPLPHLALNIQWTHGKDILRETLPAPLGQPLLREIQTQSGTTTIELLPVLFGKGGNIGLRWSFKQENPNNPVSFGGWTLLPKQAEPKLLTIQAPELISLSVFGDVSWVPPSEQSYGNPTPVHPDQASGSFSDPANDGFDKAFDSSF